MSMEIARRIITIRKENKLTQTEFAERLNATRPKIAAYELNRVNFDSAFLDYICKVFNVNAAWLATGHGEMYIETKESFVGRLSAEYELSFTAQKIIEWYLGHDVEHRRSLDEYLNSLAHVLVEAEAQAAVSGNSAPASSDSVVDKVIDIYMAADSSSGKEHSIVAETVGEIERLKNLPRVTHKDDF